MTIRPFMLAAIAGSLSFCASEPIPINYYLLSGNAPQGVTVQAAENKKTLVLETVQVADFLRQSGIVMQTADTQVQVSKRHLWAETLDTALPKLLFKELQKQSNDFNFYLKYSDFVPRSDFKLLVQIDSFQATEQGEVICSGRYQIINETDHSQIVTVDFKFNRELQVDGYDHAVEQLRLLVSDIAQSAVESANTLVAI